MPQCNKCQAPTTPQDSRGWEYFKYQDETGLTTQDVRICPNCISEFQHTQDLMARRYNINNISIADRIETLIHLHHSPTPNKAIVEDLKNEINDLILIK